MRNTVRVLLVATAILCLASGAAWAANTKASVTITMTALTSTGDASVTPLQPGQSDANQWFYSITIYKGAFNITFPVSICSTSTTGSGWGQDTISGYPVSAAFHDNGQGGNLGNYYDLAPLSNTLSADADADCPKTSNAAITVDTTGANGGAGLPVGDYTLVKQLMLDDKQDHTDYTLNEVGIHIQIHVVDPANPRVNCFITDSSFNTLFNCNGTPISDLLPGDDGNFLIITNSKNVEVSTNPGQFYYNVLYTNTTDTAQAVSVVLSHDANVNLNGTNSVHYWVFPSLNNPTLAAFNTVNSGTKNKQNLTVPAVGTITVGPGETLWVDMHLVWAGIGKAPNLPLVSFSTSCSASGSGTGFQASSIVTVNGTPTAPCGASANGYGK